MKRKTNIKIIALLVFTIYFVPNVIAQTDCYDHFDNVLTPTTNPSGTNWSWEVVHEGPDTGYSGNQAKGILLAWSFCASHSCPITSINKSYYIEAKDTATWGGDQDCTSSVCLLGGDCVEMLVEAYPDGVPSGAEAIAHAQSSGKYEDTLGNEISGSWEYSRLRVRHRNNGGNYEKYVSHRANGHSDVDTSDNTSGWVNGSATGIDYGYITSHENLKKVDSSTAPQVKSYKDLAVILLNDNYDEVYAEVKGAKVRATIAEHISCP